MPSGWEQELAERLLEVFTGETADRLDALDSALLVLETGGPAGDPGVAEALADAFRHAHTIKGGARAVGLDEVERLAHHLEDAFDRMRRDPAATLPWNAVFAAVDGLRTLVFGDRGGPPGTVDLDALIAALDAEAAGVPRPAAPSTPAPPAPEPARPAGDHVRVPLSRLEGLMAEVRELHAAGSSLRQRLLEVKAAEADTLRRSGRREAAALTGLRRRLDGDVRRIEGSAADLGEGVRRLRLIPVEVALASLQRLVRDTAAALGKQVRLEIAGAQTEADRGVLDALGGVLGHLVRNCVDHGIEDPETRRAAGKDPTGVVSVRVAEQGAHLVLTIADDGAGIDREAVAARAAAAGLVAEAGNGATLDALDLIFHPGLSTARTVTEHSGRGVGLDAVASAASALGGTVAVDSTPGEGTTFTLTLPAGMATTQCLLVGVGGRGVALPVAAVARVVRLEPDSLGQVGGRKVLAGEGAPTVMVELAEVVGWAAPAPTAAGERRLAVLGQSAGTGVGLLVDEIRGEEDLVVKPLPAPLPPSRLTRGVAILGSGEVVAVLGAAEVFRAAAVHGSPAAGPPPRPAPAPRPVVVVADDSFTTRTMLRTILAAAGYDVRAAADGQEAVELVLAGGCDAVVTDVEMPRLDGFGLCARLRSEPATREVPVVLVTALASDADRRRGVDVGADAYIVKGDFDQGELLETLRRLLR